MKTSSWADPASLYRTKEEIEELEKEFLLREENQKKLCPRTIRVLMREGVGNQTQLVQYVAHDLAAYRVKSAAHFRQHQADHQAQLLELE